MTRRLAGPYAAAVLTAACLLAGAARARAEVKSTENSRLQFGGTLGAVLNMFGGQTAKDGVQSTVAVRGDQKMTVFGQHGQLIDLAGEKIYDIDFNKKTYKVTTFDELRQQIAEDAKKAEKDTSKDEPAQPDNEHDIDLSVKPTGQTKTINGFNCHEVIATVTVREKGKTLEDGGGVVLTDDVWLVPTVAAMKEKVDFDIRYFKAIAGPYAAGVPIEQMARATALVPGLALALEKMNVDGASALDGTAIQSEMTVDSVKSKAELAEASSSGSGDDTAAGGVGALKGMFGGFGKKLAKKAAAGKDSGNGNAARSTVMTLQNQILSIATSVAADEVALPPGFRQVH